MIQFWARIVIRNIFSFVHGWIKESLAKNGRRGNVERFLRQTTRDQENTAAYRAWHHVSLSVQHRHCRAYNFLINSFNCLQRVFDIYFWSVAAHGTQRRCVIRTKPSECSSFITFFLFVCLFWKSTVMFHSVERRKKSTLEIRQQRSDFIAFNIWQSCLLSLALAVTSNCFCESLQIFRSGTYLETWC